MSARDAHAALSPEDLERFQIHSRIEVVALLRALIERRATLTVHFNQGDEFIVSSLLAVNPEFEEMVFDCSGDADANRRLARSPRLAFVSSLDQIRIQFGAARAEETRYEGLPALRARIPASVLRLQRRDAYRVVPPLGRPLLCLLPDPRDPARAHELRILDISCGGLALADGSGRLPLEVGMLLENCSLQLPEGGRVTFGAEVRSVTPHGAPGGTARYGLRFLELRPVTIARIQRYILRLDRDRRSRL
jgi:c-di-GMP-binding flagellar brake protein YcgR